MSYENNLFLGYEISPSGIHVALQTFDRMLLVAGTVFSVKPFII